MKHGIGKDFERIKNSSRKPEYKQGAKEWEDKYKSDARRREAGVGKAIDRLAKEEVEELDEAMTRKHFQQVADVIKSHPDQEKRNELAKHHAGIFKASNPRFDHSRFYQAAGANIKEEVEELDELSKRTLGSYVKKASDDATKSAASSTSFAFRSTAAKNPRVKDAAAKISDEEEARKEKRLSGIGKAVSRLSKEETEIQVINADIANGVEQIDIEESARETAQRALYLANKLRKKDPEKSKMYRNLGIKASQRSNNPTGVKAGQPYGMGNKALRKQGIEPVPSSMSSSKMRGYVEEVELEERSLSEPEMKKKEEIVMSMKKKMPGFKERYGDRAKEVMYATATKMAKKD